MARALASDQPKFCVPCLSLVFALPQAFSSRVSPGLWAFSFSSLQYMYFKFIILELEDHVMLCTDNCFFFMYYEFNCVIWSVYTLYFVLNCMACWAIQC